MEKLKTEGEIDFQVGFLKLLEQLFLIVLHTYLQQ